MVSIEQSIHEGITYYSTVSRGTRYSLRQYKGEWELYSKRLALGRSSPGSFRFFDSLEKLEASVKAFAGIGMLIGNDKPVGAAKH